jgi:hypothetical protein
MRRVRVTLVMPYRGFGHNQPTAQQYDRAREVLKKTKSLALGAVIDRVFIPQSFHQQDVDLLLDIVCKNTVISVDIEAHDDVMRRQHDICFDFLLESATPLPTPTEGLSAGLARRKLLRS